jgi:hypothetical protein
LQCRSHPSPRDFPAIREFNREFCDSEALGDSFGVRTTVLQPPIEQFPTQANREINSGSRDFYFNIREFYL